MSIMNLFNGGGSVRSKPSSSSGPKTRQKLQPRTPDVLGNVSDRYYRSGNVEGMKRINQEFQDRIQNHPSLQPGTGRIFNTSPIEGGPIGPGSWWNAGLQSGDNTGVRLAAVNNSAANQMMDDYNIFMGDYNTNAEPWSFEARGPLRRNLLNQWIKRKASEEDQNLLREQGYQLDAPIGFNFRTGLPGSNQGGGWTQFIPRPGDDMLNWQFDTKYGDFGLGIGDDQVGFNYKVGLGG